VPVTNVPTLGFASYVQLNSVGPVPARSCPPTDVQLDHVPIIRINPPEGAVDAARSDGDCITGRCCGSWRRGQISAEILPPAATEVPPI
jgi:hypothetical protein